MNEISDLLNTARDALEAGRRVALATVVEVDGSAYRHEGAKLLIYLDDDDVPVPVGLISGGCLEGEVAQIAREVLEAGEPRRHSFDMRDDALFGLGSGCGGVVDVLIEPFDDGAALAAWQAALAARRPLLRALVRRGGDSAPLGAHLLLIAGGEVAGGEVHGDLAATPLGAAVEARARGLLAEGASAARVEPFGDSEVLFDPMAPMPRLLLFGAGVDARPVAELAGRLGFVVTVVDPRRAFLSEAAFPAAERVSVHPEGYAEALKPDDDTSVVIMNHHFERDRAGLRFALERRAPFVGVLGPRHRLDKLLTALADEGCVPTAEQRATVRNPVGLDLGAEGPEQIALSIVAQLLAERRGRSGRALAAPI